jgi:spore coat polysaccharide biosynthesis predicted glycosyltransferase SpsG
MMRSRGRQPVTGQLLVALGGGSHVASIATRLSRALADRMPDMTVRVASGFATGIERPSLVRAEWIDAPNGLATELSHAEIAIVAGGVTAYECCALGVPAIALPVTSAQRQTTHALARLGAVVEGGYPPTDDSVIARVAEMVASLHGNARARSRISNAAQRVVDGCGAFRVADRLRQLVIERSSRAQASPENEHVA